jgi:hypothetical protein
LRRRDVIAKTTPIADYLQHLIEARGMSRASGAEKRPTSQLRPHYAGLELFRAQLTIAVFEHMQKTVWRSEDFESNTHGTVRLTPHTARRFAALTLKAIPMADVHQVQLRFNT